MDNIASDIAIGTAISLFSSSIDAIGLNLQRRDHVKNAALPIEMQKPEWKRPMWILGISLFVSSQLFGSSAALNFLQPAVVAPLSSATLVFNLIFARLLVGTKLRKIDYVGTSMIIICSILIAIFGEIPKQKLTLDELLKLYRRTDFIIYFSILIFISLSVIAFSTWLNYLVNNFERRSKSLFRTIRINKMKQFVGVGFAVSSGLVASVTVLLAETGVRLLSSTFQGDNQFIGATPWVILTILLISAFTQIFCINAGLRVSDAVIVVPIFFSFYSTLALFNQNVYYDIWGEYQPGNYGALFSSLIILICGVYLISRRPLPPSSPTSSTEMLESIRHSESNTTSISNEGELDTSTKSLDSVEEESIVSIEPPPKKTFD